MFLDCGKGINMLKKTFASSMAAVISLAALCSSSANAAAGWGQSMTIVSIIPVDTGLTLAVSSNGGNPMACSNSTWLHMDTGDANYALISSTILTAFAQGKAVMLWQDACLSDGEAHFTAAWVNK